MGISSSFTVSNQHAYRPSPNLNITPVLSVLKKGPIIQPLVPSFTLIVVWSPFFIEHAVRGSVVITIVSVSYMMRCYLIVLGRKGEVLCVNWACVRLFERFASMLEVSHNQNALKYRYIGI